MRTLTREFYLSPEARDVGPLDLGGAGADATIYTWEKQPAADRSERFYALCFHGKAARPDLHGYFRNAEARSLALAEYLDGRRRHREVVAEYRGRKLSPHTLKVGDILEASWGYDQTNIDFYEVTRVIGAHTVELREIAQQRTETEFMQGDCLPVAGKYIGPATRHRAGADNSVKVRDFGVWARPWKGGSRHWTAYA